MLRIVTICINKGRRIFPKHAFNGRLNARSQQNKIDFFSFLNKFMVTNWFLKCLPRYCSFHSEASTLQIYFQVCYDEAILGMMTRGTNLIRVTAVNLKIILSIMMKMKFTMMTIAINCLEGIAKKKEMTTELLIRMLRAK